MYSSTIVNQNLARVIDYERRRRNDPRWTIHRFDSDLISEMVAELDAITDDRTGAFTTELTDSQQRFIDNEMMLCQLSYEHFATNYCYIELSALTDRPEGWDELSDDRESGSAARKSRGPLGKFIFNGMQIALMQRLGKLEEIAYDQMARGVPVNGILLILLKARRLGASTLWQSLIRHRVNFYSHFPALAASIDSQATQLLQRRSDLMHEHMPAWMRARIKRQTVDQGIEFENGSMISLQDFKQEKDLGKGEGWLGFHGTEISVVPQQRAEDHFDEGLFPTIPSDRRVLFGMESTAKGKQGWWYDFCSAVMSGSAEGGAGRFDWFFAPFYLIDAMDSSHGAHGQQSKYRMEHAPDWEPSRATQLMAERVWDTSPQYMPDGSRVRLDKTVLKWYETTRAMYYKKGRLNIFLQSYPVEPIDAFQHSAAGAFPVEMIDRLTLSCAQWDPVPYRIMTEDELESVESYRRATYDDAPESPRPAPMHSVAGYQLGPMHPAEIDKDPRGVVWMWEQPDARWAYYLGCDPTGGIPKWSRAFRVHNDVNTDNGVVQVWRKERAAQRCEECGGLGWRPTTSTGVQIECAECDARGRVNGRVVQVAEFAAPIDAEELATYVYLLGRLYRGSSDLDECTAIVERNNTGILTIRKLQNTFGYTNLWQTQSISEGETMKLLNGIGFLSHSSTVPVLHARGRIVLMRRDVEPRSRWMVKELSDAIVKTIDVNGHPRERFEVPAGGGRHDDRMTAAFLSWWSALGIDELGDGETAFDSAARELPVARNLAATDASAADQHRVWNEATDALLGDFDLDFGHHPDCDINCRADHTAEDAYDPASDDGDEYSGYSDEDSGLF